MHAPLDLPPPLVDARAAARAAAGRRRPAEARMADARSLVERLQGIGDPRRARGARRALGQYGTPRPLAHALADAVRGAPGTRYLDPACGAGGLLLALVEAGVVPIDDAAMALHGIDIDETAVIATRAVIALLSGRRSNDPLIVERVRRADALLAFPDDGPFAAPFDGVVANPPWVSHSGRHAVRIDEGEAAALAARYAAFRGWPSQHGAFAERAVAAVAPGGRCALLLPDAVAERSGYATMRTALTAQLLLDPVEPYREGAVPGVAHGAVLVAGRRRARRVTGTDAPWPTVHRSASSALLDEAVRHLRTLPRPAPHAFGDIGVHSGNAARALFFDAPGPGRVPVREGRDVHPGSLAPPRRYVATDCVATPTVRFRLGDLQAQRAVPILLRQTARRPIAAAHEPPAAFRNSVLACRGLDGASTAAALLWLNASAIAWWHACQTTEAGQRSFPQVKIRHLRDLPLPPGGASALPEPTGDDDDDDAAVSRALGLSAGMHAAIVAALLS